MGIYAQTDFEITCDTAKTAKKALAVLKAMHKKDKNGNFVFEDIKQSGKTIFGIHSSGRYQNLEWQCQEMWGAIQNIKGVQEANFPFMVEGDGLYFDNDN